MSVRNLLATVSVIFAIWMGAAPAFFGIGNELMRWYLPLIALPYLVLQLAALYRAGVAERRGRKVGRAVYVALALSWACALGFGLTVPERANGELVSVMGHFFGQLWNDMSIALCNPLGIIALVMAAAALIFAIAAGRDPRLTEDELLDAAEQEAGMVPHPLSRND